MAHAIAIGEGYGRADQDGLNLWEKLLVDLVDQVFAQARRHADAEATLERLHTLGCDMVQSYFLSRPMTSELVAAWMKSRAPQRNREPVSLRRVV